MNTKSSPGTFYAVDANRVRHLRDGREAFPAMLEAIDEARHEILLEMYWVGDDVVGTRFRDRLVARAREGVAVFVSYDGIGSMGMFRSFWAPLTEAGGKVTEHGPIAPWRRGFNLVRLFFRDHRKILVTDGEIAFCGGLNLARQWLPREEGGEGWRDDVIEVRGPLAQQLRDLARQGWKELCQQPARGEPFPTSARAWVLENRIVGRPNRRIRRAYLFAIRHALETIDITNPYFLPGPRFLGALRAAQRRGVRVRLLVPEVSDVWLVNLAMRPVLAKLAREGIEVYAYRPAVLHAKTAVLDDRFVVIGSHNLDAFSWRFDLEANVVIDDRAFAAEVSGSFEADLASSTRLFPACGGRPCTRVVLDWLAARLRTLL